MEENKLVLSSLPKTWILDLDGTMVKHNGYKEGNERLNPGIKEFLDNLPEKDVVLILTARSTDVQEETKRFLVENGVRFDHILFNLPIGERILINDKKPKGLLTAHAVNIQRDGPFHINVVIDKRI
ncbi:hypothetical protein [Anoxynatronum sibiricum]|uniref:Uncharacterized protein n=1 Tax=Anoxynatronum sibiricum TaxID=210623 RepID=A0ABU9VXX8_9CLOT